MKYDVYLAAPFFSSCERTLNLSILHSLENAGLQVFYPARDGIVAKDEIASGKLMADVLAAVWQCDTDAIVNSRTVLAVLDGRVSDEGVCVEIGYASALKKIVVGYHTDDRKCFAWGLNPMVLQALTTRVSSNAAAVVAIKKCLGR
jgi:nucleoside 2-deoxyribosyltransferase